jgi:hypothetical protein
VRVNAGRQLAAGSSDVPLSCWLEWEAAASGRIASSGRAAGAAGQQQASKWPPFQRIPEPEHRHGTS